MSRFFSRSHSSLTPYVPGEQPRDTVYVKLNTNESPYPPSENAVKLAAEATKQLNLYSDPTCSELCRVFSEKIGVNSDEVIFGNGSDEILYLAFRAFCDSEVGAVFPTYTYGFYEVFAELCGVNYRKIPLRGDFSINVSDYKNAGATVFIANPNAPTSLALTRAEIEEILKSNPDNIVVIDEAYVDFGAESCVSLINSYPNLLVTQTFSKSRSMAGARLGMGIASKEIIKDLNTVKYSINPYNVNKMTMAAGIGAILDSDYTEECCRRVIEVREYTEDELEKLGFSFPRSMTNFIFAKHGGVSGEELYKELRKRGILVRHFNMPEITDYNRITVGTREQSEILLKAIKEILEEKTK